MPDSCAKAADQIGAVSYTHLQFSVGFYSAFMVSDKVTVISRAYGADKAYKWESSGADGYTITECDKDGVGTDVIMHLKADDENERYSDYLQAWKIMRPVCLLYTSALYKTSATPIWFPAASQPWWTRRAPRCI